MAITVPYAEMWPFPKGGWYQGNFYAVRKLICLSTDAPTLLGQIGTYPDCAWPAAQYPWGPSDALAQGIRIDPHPAAISALGGDTRFASYEYTELTVTYSTQGFTWVNNAMVRERFTSSQERVAIPASLLQWPDTTPCRQGEDGQLSVVGMVYSREYNNLVTSPPDTTDWCGYINANVVYAATLDRTMAAETLLYAGSDLSVRFAYVGGKRWNVKHNFVYRRQGWNTLPRIGAGGGVLGFERVHLRSTGAVVNFFPSVNF